MRIDGACHCGQVSFSAEVDPARVAVCHCTDCQVLSGAPLRAIVTTPIEHFRLRGTTKTYVKVAQSGNPRAQVFCPECGTPLYSSARDDPTHVTIRVGCVAQRAALLPSAQIWQRSQQPWLAGLQSIPGVPEQPPRP